MIWLKSLESKVTYNLIERGQALSSPKSMSRSLQVSYSLARRTLNFRSRAYSIRQAQQTSHDYKTKKRFSFRTSPGNRSNCL